MPTDCNNSAHAREILNDFFPCRQQAAVVKYMERRLPITKYKFEKKTLTYPPEHSRQTPLVLENAYCHGGLATAKRGKGWLIHVEKTGVCVSNRHAFRNLRFAKEAVIGLADMEGIDWRSSYGNPIKDTNDPVKTRENFDSVKQILDCCKT